VGGTIDMSCAPCCDESSGGGACVGQCTFMWTGTDWAPISNTCNSGTPGCTCAQPSIPGTVFGEMRTVDCFIL
jgi:hypothetical protein